MNAPANVVCAAGGTVRGTFDVMDKWLSCGRRGGHERIRSPTRIIRKKPPEAGQRVAGSVARCSPTSRCDLLWPVLRRAADGRGRTEGPRRGQGQLKPLDRTDDYGLVPFTDLQWQRLKGAFPNGGRLLEARGRPFSVRPVADVQRRARGAANRSVPPPASTSFKRLPFGCGLG